MAQQALKPILHFKRKEAEEYFTIIETPEDEEPQLQIGDLLLLGFEGNSMFKLASVYCGDRQIIQFAKLPKGKLSWIICFSSSSSSKPGEIKVFQIGIDQMLGTTKPIMMILRSKKGIDEKAFDEKMPTVMNMEITHDLNSSNCIHFALHILDLKDCYNDVFDVIKK